MLEYMQDDKDIYIGARVRLGFLTQEVIARRGCPCIGVVQSRKSNLKQDEDRVHT